MSDKGTVFAKLMHLATSNGITVRFAPLQYNDARIVNNRVAIRQDLKTIDEINYNLAHELAHVYLHYDKGDTMASIMHTQYEEQADRAAKMLLEALNT